MTPPKSTDGGMNILLGIRIQVMQTVVSCLPEHTFLRRHRSAKGHNKLHDAPKLVGTMGKITMVASSNKKHANGVKRKTKTNIKQANPGYNSKKRH